MSQIDSYHTAPQANRTALAFIRKILTYFERGGIMVWPFTSSHDDEAESGNVLRERSYTDLNRYRSDRDDTKHEKSCDSEGSGKPSGNENEAAKES